MKKKTPGAAALKLFMALFEVIAPLWWLTAAILKICGVIQTPWLTILAAPLVVTAAIFALAVILVIIGCIVYAVGSYKGGWNNDQGIQENHHDTRNH